MIARRLALALVPALAACVDSGPTWRTDVEPIVEASCRHCHTAGGGAPFALDTYAQALPMKDAMKAAVAERRMPPWLARPGCAEYAADESLTDAQIATIAAWADAGGPEGFSWSAQKAQPLASVEKLSRVDVSLQMPAPYAPSTAAPDDYRCFILDWPADHTGYVSGFRAKPGNAQVVHHVIAFLIPPGKVADYEARDDREPGPGWTCFGAPGGAGDTGINWLGAWAPGSNGRDFPAGTGLRVEPGSKVALQVHYNTSVAPASVEDLTAVEFKVDDTVEKVAVMLPWADPDWVVSRAMPIPKGEADVVHSFDFDPTPYMSYLSRGAIPDDAPFLVYSASLHMHTLGTSGSLYVKRASGDPECLLEIGRWDFGWQRSYAFSQPKTVRPGDRLYLECHWDNSRSRLVGGVRTEPTDANWGEGTGDEMCLGLFYVTAQ